MESQQTCFYLHAVSCRKASPAPSWSQGIAASHLAHRPQMGSFLPHLRCPASLLALPCLFLALGGCSCSPQGAPAPAGRTHGHTGRPDTSVALQVVPGSSQAIGSEPFLFFSWPSWGHTRNAGWEGWTWSILVLEGLDPVSPSPGWGTRKGCGTQAAEG